MSFRNVTLKGRLFLRCNVICFVFPCWIRFTFLELLWEAFWLKNLLNTHTNLPEFNLWFCVMPLVTLPSSIRRGQQTGKEDWDKQWGWGHSPVFWWNFTLICWSGLTCVWLVFSLPEMVRAGIHATSKTTLQRKQKLSQLGAWNLTDHSCIYFLWFSKDVARLKNSTWFPAKPFRVLFTMFKIHPCNTAAFQSISITYLQGFPALLLKLFTISFEILAQSQCKKREVLKESILILMVTSRFCFSFWLMPAFMLKKIVLGNFASGPLDPEMADGIDFMVDRVGGCALQWL